MGNYESINEKNAGSTSDFVTGLDWRTSSLHKEFLETISPKGHIPCGAERLGRPVTAEVVEAVNSDRTIADSQTSATDSA